MGLIDYWLVVRRRWRLIAFLAGLVFVCGVTITLLQTPTYRAEATVLVEDQKSSQLDVLDGLSGMSGPIPVETEMEIIKSRSIAEEVVSTLGLETVAIKAPLGTRVRLTNYQSTKYPSENRPEFRIEIKKDGRYVAFDEDGGVLGNGIFGQRFSGNGVAWVLQVTSPTFSDTLRFRKFPFQSAVATLQRNTSVKEVGKKTNIIAVTVDAPDPFSARDIADTVTAAYLRYNIARKSQVASQTLEFIGQQLDSIKGNLEAGEEELGAFKSKMGIFVLSDSAKNIIDQITHLETARADFTLQKREIDSLHSALERAGGKDDPYLLGQVSFPDPLVGQLVSELSRYLIELRALRHELAEDNAKISLLKEKIEESKVKVKLAIDNARKSLENRERIAGQLIVGYENRLKKLPESERHLAALTRKSEVNAELYTFLLKKHEEARITRAGIVGNVSVLDSALVPSTPASPNVKLSLLVSVFLGLFVGLLGAFVLEYVDETLKTVEDVTATLGLNVYGVIPFVPNHESSPIFVEKLDPRDGVREAFRTFRTNLEFTDTENKIKTVVAVSAIPGVGKSTTMANLAVTLSQAGHKVLLVDCDLRRPQIHTFFGIDVQPGLTNAILSEGDWRRYVVHGQGVERLCILPAGVLPPNPAEFLGSQKFQQFMRQAKEQFDFVLYDVPPIVAFTDAALVAARVDAVFVVLELFKSSIPLLRRSLELLGNVQAKTRGAIVNKAGAFAAGTSYYGYGYGYYEGVSSQTNSRLLIWKRLKSIFSNLRRQ